MTTIRPLTLDDFDALDALMREIHAHHVAGVPRIFRMPETPVIPREVLAEGLAKPLRITLGGFDGDQMVGFVEGEILERPASHTHHARHVLFVDTLVVAGTHQGRGIGRALMHTAEAWGRGQGADEAVLTVWQFNGGAIDFYERLGYETEQLRMSKRL